MKLTDFPFSESMEVIGESMELKCKTIEIYSHDDHAHITLYRVDLLSLCEAIRRFDDDVVLALIEEIKPK